MHTNSWGEYLRRPSVDATLRHAGYRRVPVEVAKFSEMTYTYTRGILPWILGKTLSSSWGRMARESLLLLNVKEVVSFAHSPMANFTEGRTFRLYIKTLSTHEDHPKARHPKLEFSIPPSPRYGTFIRSLVIQI